MGELLARARRFRRGGTWPLVWTRFDRDGRRHANARMLMPDPASPGSMTWAQVITSDARTRLGRELHVIRGRVAVRWALTKVAR